MIKKYLEVDVLNDLIKKQGFSEQYIIDNIKLLNNLRIIDFHDKPSITLTHRVVLGNFEYMLHRGDLDQLLINSGDDIDVQFIALLPAHYEENLPVCDENIIWAD